jgi:hypothetical protein
MADAKTRNFLRYVADAGGERDGVDGGWDAAISEAASLGLISRIKDGWTGVNLYYPEL